MTHLTAELTRNQNLVPKRDGRTAPRQTKRGGSPRYPRRKDDTAPTRRVTHTIVMHPLTPRPSPDP